MRDIKAIRTEIDITDKELSAILQKRHRLALEAAAYKKNNGLPIADNAREEEIKQKLASEPDSGFLIRCFEKIIEECRNSEYEV